MKDENNDEADILITISSVVLRFYDDDGGDNLCVRISVQMLSNSSADKRDFFGGDLSFFVFLSKITICCLLYTSPSPRDLSTSRMPSSA